MTDVANKSRVPTIPDIARQASVSVGTASKVLANAPGVRREKRHRVLRAASQLGYVPDLQARAMRTGKTRRIGILLPSLDNTFYIQKLQSVRRVAWGHGYDTTFFSLDWDEGADSACRHLLSLGIDGLIIAGPLRGDSLDYTEIALARGVPIVVLAEHPIDEQRVSTIGVNTAEGARLAGDHLLSLGHERIGLVGITEAHSRVSGIRDAFSARGLGSEAITWIPAGGDTMEAGFEAIARFLGQGGSMPSALFALNDQLAQGVLTALHGAGLNVPSDVAVVGHDNIRESRFTTPPLTTVSQMHLQLGQRAVELILQRLKQPNEPPVHVSLSPRLVVRASCGAIRMFR